MNKILIVVGSKSDLFYLTEIRKLFKEFKVNYSELVVSCHRNLPKLIDDFKADNLKNVGIIIAIANSVANLPAIIAGYIRPQPIPVIGVGLTNKGLGGLESLISVNTIPRGTPLLNTGVGEIGLYNAGICAIRILARDNKLLQKKLIRYFNK